MFQTKGNHYVGKNTWYPAHVWNRKQINHVIQIPAFSDGQQNSWTMPPRDYAAEKGL